MENHKYEEKFINILATITTLKSQLVSLQQQIKKLEQDVSKDLNNGYKEIEKKNKKLKNRKPSGFAKPCKISKELSTFMNKNEDELVARTDVTKYLIDYIKKENLQNKDNKKQIIPDVKLKKLLVIKDNDELTYFNIQKFMNKHFI
tara:strand:- start:795 stop:1232 length:438 start_codon:yes stop_codon:yes gene_type:complete